METVPEFERENFLEEVVTHCKGGLLLKETDPPDYIIRLGLEEDKEDSEAI